MEESKHLQAANPLGSTDLTRSAIQQDVMPPDPQEEIDALLASYQGPEPERVRRALVLLAQGDPQKLAYFLDRAKGDHRDILWWADIQDQKARKNRPSSA